MTALLTALVITAALLYVAGSIWDACMLGRGLTELDAARKAARTALNAGHFARCPENFP